ncbi:MAG: hypothetical protein JWP89_75 [Schlesneria sp.]|nr:hypothetical protein [Schlesneria sp.]
MLFLLAGCKHTPRQTMTGLWESVPQVRWTGSRVEPGQPAKPEPSVAANAAASVSKPDANSRSPSTSEKPTRTGLASGSSKMDPVQTAGNVETTNQVSASGYNSEAEYSAMAQDSATTENGLADQGQDQIERLKAALDDDAERAEGSPRQSGSAHDVRVRVDSMVEKARRLFDLGQLREARHAAKVAHDLGDSARLDYSPDEERPIDLVQRIDDRIKETMELADEVGASPSTTIADVTPTSPPPVANTAATAANSKPAPLAKVAEPDSSVKTRKDWTQGLNVFRPYRKSNPVAASLAAPIPTVMPNAEIAIPLGLETDIEANETNDRAVVQANRSLTLSKPAHSNSLSERQDFVESPENSADLNEESSEVVSLALGAEASRNQSDLSISPAWPDEFVAPHKLNVEEPTSTPVDFDEVEPLSPFRDVAGQSSIPAAPPAICDSPRPCDQSWVFGSALFAVCAIVAVFWYRRGAV